MNFRQRLYLLTSIVACGLTVGLSLSHGWTVQNLAWTFWALSFVTGSLTVALAAGLRFRDSGSKPTSLGIFSILGILLFLILSLLGLVFSLTVVGALSSFFLQMEPKNIFGPNGFINNFDTQAFVFLWQNYGLLVLPFLLIQTKLLTFSAGGLRSARGAFGPGIILLPFGIFATMTGFLLKDQVSPETASAISIGVFSVLYFAPWRLIELGDIGSLAQDERAALDVPPHLPATYAEPRHRTVGIVMMAASLLFFIMILGPFLTGMFGAGALSILFALFAVLFVGSICFIFLLVGIHMAFYTKKVRISRSEVSVEDRYFTLGIEKIFTKLRKKQTPRTWTQVMSRYKSVRIEEVYHSGAGTDSSSYTEYTVILAHESNTDYDVTVYRAYHERGWRERGEQWAHLLDLPEKVKKRDQ